MALLDAIGSRRSVRRFTVREVPPDAVQVILESATRAPSGKNRQSWYFVVLSGGRKAQFVHIMQSEICRWKAQGRPVGIAKASARAINAAPVTILVFNRCSKKPPSPSGLEYYMHWTEVSKWLA